VTDILTPAAIVATLSTIGRELDAKSEEVVDLDECHVRLRGAYKSAFARAFLMCAGSNDVRRYTAEVETEGLALEAELAEQVLRAARESMKVLRDRLEIGRSLSSVMKTEWGAQ
jgi:hypothetical protein